MTFQGITRKSRVKGSRVMALHSGKSIGHDRNAPALDDVVAAFRLKKRTERIFDVVAAAMGLILFTPILLITSIAIKLEFSRPYIYPRDPIRIREIQRRSL